MQNQYMWCWTGISLGVFLLYLRKVFQFYSGSADNHPIAKTDEFHPLGEVKISLFIAVDVGYELSIPIIWELT